MTKGVIGLACLIITASITASRAESRASSESQLIKLASAKFPNLTRAERAMLQFADKGNFARGEFAVAGTSPDPADPSNDPKNASKWPHERDVRVQLIRWLAIDEHASALVDPKGIRVLGARIVGPLDLKQVRVPFPIALVRCSIPEVIVFDYADMPSLDLSGSDTAGFSGISLNAHAFVNLGSDPRTNVGGFMASGLVNLSLAKADNFYFQGGHFHFSAAPYHGFYGFGKSGLKEALVLFHVESKGDVELCCGFESEGAVLADESNIGGDLNCSGGRFLNPNNIALSAGLASIAGSFIAGDHPFFGGKAGFEADGAVFVPGARVGVVYIQHARFAGKARDWHGLYGTGISARSGFIWQNVRLENGATLDLRSANVGLVIDDEGSWPQPGKLLIDLFTYTGFGGQYPGDARSRLRWLGLQDGYYPQPYRQLAKVLRENGDEAGAVQVLIAAGDARYSKHGWPGRMLGWLLKITIGYGHRPMLALLWALGIVLIGWAAVFVGKRAHVMRLTWPETTPPPTGDTSAGLNPLLYSVDLFLPFVNLHQEHYWWPDEQTSGECSVAGLKMIVRGSALRTYLWLQIVAGWLLSAIFIAGVTGLLRND